MFVILRILIGSIFIISGLEKLLHPYQNFLYALQAYALLPGFIENIVAQVFPWVEFFAGVFLVLGLWTRQSLLAVMVFFGVFIAIVGQALLRGLDIDNCGCFGQWVHIPPYVIIVFDSGFLMLTLFLLNNLFKTSFLSLDRFYSRV